ncbi:MAG: protein translocase subunit SecD [Proteobacteria bacterium]|nr:protein translocase subunit SecD [Pseudomonadota bacterium]
MLNFSRTKIITILAVCFLALFYALPSFISPSFFEKNPAFTKFLPSQKVNLGLDLRGGSQLTMEVDFDYYIKEQLNNLKEELKSSFRDEAVRAVPSINADKITFSLTDEEQKKSAKKLIKKVSNRVEVDENSGQFQIYFSDQEIALMKQNLIKQSIEIVRKRIDESGTKEPTIQAQGENRILLQVPGVENSDEIKSILGKTAKMTFHNVSDKTFSASDEGFDSDLERLFDYQGRAYLIKKEVVLSGDLLIDASATYHEGQPAVAFRFNDVGSRKFAEITKENIGKFFAIVLDGKVVTAPRINTVINQGSGVISGNFTVAEANEVALLLRAGALPAPLKIVEERTVGPSLGSDSIKSGSLAAVAGLAFVAIFMMLFYGFFGLLANIAMFINIASIIAILSMIGATLTLPGIAGIVLTMGMSVDSNVLIFERIKEELRAKKTILGAVEQGFSQAFRTIVDSNITTLIVAFFLYVFGNGPVKGFAVTLSIGIISSMFAAIVLTRMMIALWIKNRRPKKLNLI